MENIFFFLPEIFRFKCGLTPDIVYSVFYIGSLNELILRKNLFQHLTAPCLTWLHCT